MPRPLYFQAGASRGTPASSLAGDGRIRHSGASQNPDFDAHQVFWTLAFARVTILDQKEHEYHLS
jgi:hypothetical protein